jgi:hypothetical protein
MTKQRRATQRRAPRFSEVTKGIRLRVDQIEALERLFLIDKELDWSKAARKGVDLLIAEYDRRFRQ